MKTAILLFYPFSSTQPLKGNYVSAVLIFSTICSGNRLTLMLFDFPLPVLICLFFNMKDEELILSLCLYNNHKYFLSSLQIKTSDQIRSVAQSCPTLCDPMNRSTPGLPVHHQLPEFTQTHNHRVSDAIRPSHPLASPSPPAPNPSQHQSLFQWVNSSHEVAKVLEFQL